MVRTTIWSLGLGLILAAAVARGAEEKGLPELDKATELQLSAETLSDLEKVVESCEKALAAGLGEGNQKFAKQLAASTLFEHAKRIVSSINEQQGPNPRWQSYQRLALKDLDKALTFDTENSEVHLLRAKLHGLPGGDPKQAMKAATEAIRLLADDNEKRAEAHLLRAKLQDDPEKQLAEYDAAIKADPENVEAWQGRALAYLGKGDNDKAIADLTRLLEQNGDNVMARFALAEAFANLKKYDEALAQLAKGIEARPDQPFGYLLRARVNVMQDKLDAALEDLNKALKSDPGDPSALLMRSRLLQEAGKMAEARADVDRVLKLSPGNSQALLFRSGLLAGEKKYAEAIADVDRLLQKSPANVELRLHVASLYASGGWPRKAIAMISELVNTDPDNWMALRARGDIYLSVGKHAEAIADFQKALKHQPENSGILNNYAWVLATSPDDKLRDGKRSLELAQKACEATRFKAPHILSTLASAYAEMGDFEKAIEWSTKAVDLGDADVKAQLQKELDGYKEKKPVRELQQTEEKPNPPSLHDSPEL